MRARIAFPLCLIASLCYSGCGETPKPNNAAQSTSGAATTTTDRQKPVGDADKQVAGNPAPEPAKEGTPNPTVKNSDESIDKVDMRFIPADAFAAVVAYPARVLKSPAIAKVDLKGLFGKMEQELGLSLSDVEQVMFVASFVPRAGGGPPATNAAMEVRLSKPHGGEAFVKRGMAPDEPQKVEYDGKTYYTAGKDHANRPVACLIDDRTFLFGDEPEVKAMIDAKDVKTPLTALLAKADPAADFSLFATSTEQIRKMVADAKSKGAVPPPLQPFAEASESLTGSILAIKTTPEISLSLTMEGKDEAAAEKLATMVPQAKQIAEQMLPALRQMAGAAPPDAKKTLDYGLGKLEKIVAGMTPQRKGNQVVIQINGLGTVDELADMLASTVSKARDAAKLNLGLNNLRQLGLSILNYESGHKAFPPQAIYSKDGKPLLSWRVAILPQLDEMELYKQFHLDEPWDSPNNKPLIAKIPKTLVDPNGKPIGEGKTRYVVPTGKGTMFDGDQGMTFAQITDGSSNTLMILEVGEDKAVTWTQPDDLQFDPAKPLAGLGKIPDSGFGVVFADCHTMLIHKTVDPDTFRKLILRADGEPIDQTKF